MLTTHPFCWVWLHEKGEILVIDSSQMESSLLGNEVIGETPEQSQNYLDFSSFE